MLEPQMFIINWKSARAIVQCWYPSLCGYCKFETRHHLKFASLPTLPSPQGQGIISNFNCTLILAHCIAAAHEDACCFDMNSERHQTCLHRLSNDNVSDFCQLENKTYAKVFATAMNRIFSKGHLKTF